MQAVHVEGPSPGLEIPGTFRLGVGSGIAARYGKRMSFERQVTL
jgi:hypothetical protein